MEKTTNKIDKETHMKLVREEIARRLGKFDKSIKEVAEEKAVVYSRMTPEEKEDYDSRRAKRPCKIPVQRSAEWHQLYLEVKRKRESMPAAPYLNKGIEECKQV